MTQEPTEKQLREDRWIDLMKDFKHDRVHILQVLDHLTQEIEVGNYLYRSSLGKKVQKRIDNLNSLQPDPSNSGASIFSS